MAVDPPATDASRGSSPLSPSPAPALQSPPRLLSPLPELALSLPMSPSVAPTSPTVAASTPAPSSPASTLVDLDISSSKKRNQELAGLDMAGLRRSKRICPSITGTTADVSVKDGGHLVGGLGDGAGGAPGEPRKADCKRGGAAARAAMPVSGRAPKTIAEIQQSLEEELSGVPLDDEEEEDELSDEDGGNEKSKAASQSKSKLKSTPAKERWSIKKDPPTLCAVTARPIVWLSYGSTSPELQQNLKQLLISLSSSSSAPPAPSNLAPIDKPAPLITLALKCAALELETVVNDFHQMMTYIQFAFLFELTSKACKKDKKHFNLGILHRQCRDSGSSITHRSLQKWYTAGSRLIYLVSASSMYLIPILAACGMKTRICFKSSCKQIQVLAFTLCNPAVADASFSLTVSCGKLVRDVIVPQMALVKQLSSALDATAFGLHVSDTETIPFSALGLIQKHVRAFNVNFFVLPLQDAVWTCLNIDMLTPAIAPVLAPAYIDSTCVGEEIRITTTFKLGNAASPVNKKNRKPFTIQERAKAVTAHEVQALKDLQPEIHAFHQGDFKNSETPYLCMDTKIAGGKVLHFRDADDQLIALVATNLAETVPHLNTTLLSQLSSIMTGEVSEVESHIDNPFLAWHCNVWNRYGEKGDSAPKNVHPNFVHGSKASNKTQRFPYASKEVEEHPEEAELLAEMIHLITIIVEHHLKKLLPDDYEVIKVFVNQLPLNERSLAYPFGGFVINIGVATKAHRDQLDKDFCVIIPFGTWTGGELCLYEPGFVFRLQPWDILIFPSCDI
ncbi:hypothetical protein C8R47DRAFT_1125184, partial [Mycena vitilis]